MDKKVKFVLGITFTIACIVLVVVFSGFSLLMLNIATRVDLDNEIGVWQTEDGVISIECLRTNEPTLRIKTDGGEKVYQIGMRGNIAWVVDPTREIVGDNGVVDYLDGYHVCQTGLLLKAKGEKIVLKISQDSILGSKGEQIVLYRL